MKFENKKWVLRVALAGALSLGVATVAKADDATTTANTVAVGNITWNALAQESAVQSFGTAKNPGPNYGDSLNAGLENVRVKASYGIDALDTLTVQTSFAASTGVGTYFGGFTLLDAYDVHTLNDINQGLALKVGQFKTAFGQDGYATPDQLIRTQYSSILGAASPNNVANEGNNWEMGVEADQNFSDLNIQVAAVQNPFVVGNPGTRVDYVGRIQWKGTNVALGVSDYLSSTVNPNVNSLGANASINVDVLQLDLEAIFGGADINGYNGTLSAKLSGFQPAVWYEFNTTSAGAVNADDLGAGLNFNLAAKTRLALDVDFTGPNTGDILSINTETAQLQEVF
jgi:hypothetical protein